MLARWLVLLAVLFLSTQGLANASVSVFDARPVSIIVETNERLDKVVLDKLLEQYRWAFRLPAYDKQPFGEPIALKKAYLPLQDHKGKIAVEAVRGQMKTMNLQRLVLLRIDEMSAFIHRRWDLFHDDDDEVAEVRVLAVATLVDQEGRVLFQRRIRRWEWQELMVDGGPGPLLLDEWERFLKAARDVDD